MGITVHIPTPLRRVTDGKDKLEVEASSVGEMIAKADNQFPGFQERLMDETGDLRYFINIYLNGEDVRFLQGPDTPTKSGDEISIVPAVAGGCARLVSS